MYNLVIRTDTFIVSRPCEIDLSISSFARWKTIGSALPPQGSFFNLISAAKGRR